MNLYQLFLTKNACYQSGKPLKVSGLMLHSTGAPNTKLSRYVGPDDGRLGKNPYGNHWNQPKPDGRSVCVHAFIGTLPNGSIATYQTLPWTMQAWHCAGAGNRTHIGVEICEDNLADTVYFAKVYREAVELFAFLCKEFALDPMKHIICHAEGYQQGIASNHGDVLYWFKKQGKTMNDFRQAVRQEMNTPKQEEDTGMRYRYYDDVPDWAKPTISKLVKKGYLKGEGSGVLDLSEDAVKLLVINDRAGLYGD